MNTTTIDGVLYRADTCGGCGTFEVCRHQFGRWVCVACLMAQPAWQHAPDAIRHAVHMNYALAALELDRGIAPRIAAWINSIEVTW